MMKGHTMKRQPTQGELLAGGGALAWVLSFFFSWYSVDVVGLGTGSGSGSDAGGLRWLFWFLALAIAALVGLRLFDVQLPALPASTDG
jgi:hypothetical protein